MLELPEKVTSIGNGEFVDIKMNYKVHLASQYVTNQICEALGSSIEVGFLYGGTTRTTKHEPYQLTTINLDSFHLPEKQRITPITFDISPTQAYQVQHNLVKKHRRITGIAHSHGDMDVFHSGRDKENYIMMTLSDGMKIKPIRDKHTMWRIKKYAHNAIKKIAKLCRNKSKYILPTLVYNTKDEYTAGLTTHDTDAIKHHDDVNVTFYNKKQSLTDDEKAMLDRKIRIILRNLQLEKAPSNTKTDKTSKDQ